VKYSFRHTYFSAAHFVPHGTLLIILPAWGCVVSTWVEKELSAVKEKLDADANRRQHDKEKVAC
jgi:hypothetical protein